MLGLNATRGTDFSLTSQGLAPRGPLNIKGARRLLCTKSRGRVSAVEVRLHSTAPRCHALVCSSSSSRVVTVTGETAANFLRIAIVTARFNSLVTKSLLEGCVETLLAHGVQPEDIVSTWVPGSFELGIVATSMAASGKYDAVICLGAIIRGDTSHYDAVVSAAVSGVQTAAAATGIPCIFGVLTTENMEQALDRAGGKAGNIGSNAAMTAIETSTLLRTLKSNGQAA